MKISQVCFSVVFTAFSATLVHAQKTGADVYKANCVMCHGNAGDANTPAGKMFKAPSFNSAETTSKSDDDLLAIINKGKDKMPAWTGVLTESRMKDVITYIHTLQGDKAPAHGAAPSTAPASR